MKMMLIKLTQLNWKSNYHWFSLKKKSTRIKSRIQINLSVRFVWGTSKKTKLLDCSNVCITITRSALISGSISIWLVLFAKHYKNLIEIYNNYNFIFKGFWGFGVLGFWRRMRSREGSSKQGRSRIGRW